MQFDIPDGCQVHIVIGPKPHLALPNETGGANGGVGARSVARAGRPMVKAAMAGLLLFGAFVLGKQVGSVPTARPAFAAAPAATPSDPATAAPAALPPAFAQQLRQPPSLAPAPGQPSTGHSPFGLDR